LSVVCAGSVIAGAAGAALADYRIRKDYGGFIHQYKLKYATIRDRGERVIIDGVCNSACTLVLGIVPLNRICVTPRASLGFHQASKVRLRISPSARSRCGPQCPRGAAARTG
jgi:hypothetical protein